MSADRASTAYDIESVRSSSTPEFEAAFAALDAEFGPRGELERREVIARWLERDAENNDADAPIRRSYHLLIARDAHGALAGVRDCHVLIEPRAHTAVVYLAHALVLVPHRRTGLAARLRQEPVALAAQAIGAAGLVDFEVLLAAEMEPADEEDPASLIRLVAYGRDGFRAIAPEALPYFQPDFRDLGADPPLAAAKPLPLLAVVRWVGHEQASTLPRSLARAFVRHLFTVFATHVHPRQLHALKQHTLERLDAFEGDHVPLLALPRSLTDVAAARRLTRPAADPFSNHAPRGAR
jgi:hypothetical protein